MGALGGVDGGVVVVGGDGVGVVGGDGAVRRGWERWVVVMVVMMTVMMKMTMVRCVAGGSAGWC